jgi:hypothetical protein
MERSERGRRRKTLIAFSRGSSRNLCAPKKKTSQSPSARRPNHRDSKWKSSHHTHFSHGTATEKRAGPEHNMFGPTCRMPGEFYCKARCEALLKDVLVTQKPIRLLSLSLSLAPVSYVACVASGKAENRTKHKAYICVG